jgi:CspA family cold shock protein
LEASRIVSQSDLLPITTPIKAGWPEVCSIFRDNYYCEASIDASMGPENRGTWVLLRSTEQGYQKSMARGIVKWFNEKKGFGFIVDPTVSGDIFVHFSAIVTKGFRTLKEGEEVEYELYEDQKGSRAKNVMRV